MGKLRLTNFQDTDSGKHFFFEATSVKEVANITQNFFRNQGYNLEEGSPENAVYGIGNKTMRILFGAFVKRYTFNLIIKEHGGMVNVMLAKAMSGISGGAIGVNKLNKEHKRLAEAIKIL